MYSDQEVFCMDFEEMETCLAENTEKSLLRASGLLRHLLLDRLLSKGTKNVGHKVVFEVVHTFDVTRDAESMAGHMMTVQSIDPYSPASQFPSMKIVRMNLDRFITVPVKAVDGKTISIAQYIRYVANTAGGVHKGEPKDAEKALHELSARTKIHNKPLGLYAMRDILAITIRALRPIYDALKLREANRSAAKP